MFNKSPLTYFRLAVVLLILLMTESWGNFILAQTNTSNPLTTKPLPFNKMVSGQLRGKSETVTYTFDIPVNQDVMIEYRANKLVFSGHCIFTDDSLPDEAHCIKYGGSGGDRPVNSYELFPSYGENQQHVTITLVRVLDGAATYQITAHLITPQAINLGEKILGIPDSSQSYQTYTLDVDPAASFAVEIEDEAADGNFLWVAHQSFIRETFPDVEKQLFLPQYIDWANSENGAVGINNLELYYLGGHTFRVLAQSSKNYNLVSNLIKIPVLDENEPLNLTVNYHQPLQVTQLNSQPGEKVQVNFKLTTGKGAIARVYEVGSRFDEALSLGWTSANNSTFPLSGNIQRTAVKALYVVAQIPFEYTRENVELNIMWQHVN